MRRILVAMALALAVASAGCINIDGLLPVAEDQSGQSADQNPIPDPPQTDEPPTTPEPDPAPAPEPAPSEPQNAAPAAELAVNLTKGTAPLLVNITIDGSDEDGDALSWSVDLGDGSTPVEGTELPFAFDHNFTGVGNFTITLTVSDGELEAEATALVAVEEAPLELPDPVLWEGTIPLGLPNALVGDLYACINGANARLLTLASTTPPVEAGWVYAAAPEHADLFVMHWFSSGPLLPWFLQALVPEDPSGSGYLETTEGAAGTVPENATHVLACYAGEEAVQDLPFTFTLVHPLAS